MRYISTRGQAPERDFAGVLLAGLAEDGGLYMPAEWPHFSPADLRAMRGLPYAEIAARVIAPFTSGSIDYDTLLGLCRHAYAGFAHPAVALPGAAGNRPVGAGAVPWPHSGLQGHGHAAAGPHVRSRAHPARPAHHDPGRHQRRHRQRRHRGLPRPPPHQHRHPAPARPHQRGAAPANDHGAVAQRVQHRRAGQFRRLPGFGESRLRRRALPRRNAPRRRQFHQLGPHRRPGRLLCGWRPGPGRAGARSGLRRAHRQFR